MQMFDLHIKHIYITYITYNIYIYILYIYKVNGTSVTNIFHVEFAELMLNMYYTEIIVRSIYPMKVTLSNRIIQVFLKGLVHHIA